MDDDVRSRHPRQDRLAIFALFRSRYLRKKQSLRGVFYALEIVSRYASTLWFIIFHSQAITWALSSVALAFIAPRLFIRLKVYGRLIDR